MLAIDRAPLALETLSVHAHVPVRQVVNELDQARNNGIQSEAGRGTFDR